MDGLDATIATTAPMQPAPPPRAPAGGSMPWLTNDAGAAPVATRPAVRARVPSPPAPAPVPAPAPALAPDANRDAVVATPRSVALQMGERIQTADGGWADVFKKGGNGSSSLDLDGLTYAARSVLNLSPRELPDSALATLWEALVGDSVTDAASGGTDAQLLAGVARKLQLEGRMPATREETASAADSPTPAAAPAFAAAAPPPAKEEAVRAPVPPPPLVPIDLAPAPPVPPAAKKEVVHLAGGSAFGATGEETPVRTTCRTISEAIKRDASLGGNWFRLFKRVDVARLGTLGYPDLARGVRGELHIGKAVLSESQLKKMWHKLSPDADTLPIQTLAGLMRKLEHGLLEDHDKDSGAQKTEQYSALMPHDKLGHTHLKKRASVDGGRGHHNAIVRHAKPPLDLLKRLHSKMRSAAYRAGGQDWLTLFRFYDKNKSGTISLLEFRMAVRKDLNQSPGQFSDLDIEATFVGIDLDDSGVLSLTELERFLKHGPQAVGKADGPLLSPKPPPRAVLTEAQKRKRRRPKIDVELLGMLHSKFKAASYIGFGQDYTKLFLQYDKDRCGTLTLDEFHAAVRKTAKITVMNMTDRQVEKAFLMLGGADDMTISAEEFVAFMQGGVEAAKKHAALISSVSHSQLHAHASLSIKSQSKVDAKLLKRIHTTFKNQTYQEKGDPTKLFGKFDKDRSGSLELVEFGKFLNGQLAGGGLQMDMDDKTVKQLYKELGGHETVSLAKITEFLHKGPTMITAPQRRASTIYASPEAHAIKLTLIKEANERRLRESEAEFDAGHRRGSGTIPSHMTPKRKRARVLVTEEGMSKLHSKMKAAAYRAGGRDWKKLFEHYIRHFDANDKDGHLGRREFKMAVRKDVKVLISDLSDPELDSVFDFIDANNSGGIDLGELEQFILLGPKGAATKLAAQARQAEERKVVAVDGLPVRVKPVVDVVIAGPACPVGALCVDDWGTEDSDAGSFSAYPRTSPTRRENPASDTEAAPNPDYSKPAKRHRKPPKVDPKLLKRIHTTLKNQTYQEKGDPTKLFGKFDKDRSGVLELAEFERFLNAQLAGGGLQLELSEAEAKKVYRFFGGDDTVALGEIARFLQAGPQAYSRPVVMSGNGEEADSAATLIQTRYRGKEGREKAELTKHLFGLGNSDDAALAATKMQALHRGNSERDSLEIKEYQRLLAENPVPQQAATHVQALYRGKQAREKVQEIRVLQDVGAHHEDKLVKIQSMQRGKLGRVEARQKGELQALGGLEDADKSALAIQNRVRCKNAKRDVEARRYEQYCDEQGMTIHLEATRIQNQYRSKTARQKASAKAEISAVRGEAYQAGVKQWNADREAQREAVLKSGTSLAESLAHQQSVAKRRKMSKMRPRADPKLVRKMFNALRSQTYQEHGDPTKLFGKFDRDGSGFLALTEFTKLLNSQPAGGGLQLEATPQQAKSLFVYLDGEPSGDFSDPRTGVPLEKVQELLREGPDGYGKLATVPGSPTKSSGSTTSSSYTIGGPRRPGESRPAGMPGRGPRPELAPELISQMRRNIQAASYTAKGADLDQLFAKWDTDNSGTLSPGEFLTATRKIMKVQKAQVSDAEVGRIFKLLDDSGNENVSLESLRNFVNEGAEGFKTVRRRRESVAAVDMQSLIEGGATHTAKGGGQPASPTRAEKPRQPSRIKAILVKRAHTTLKNQCYQEKGDPTKLFGKFDKDRSGVLELAEFERFLNAQMAGGGLGLGMEDEDVRQMYAELGGRETISLDMIKVFLKDGAKALDGSRKAPKAQALAPRRGPNHGKRIRKDGSTHEVQDMVKMIHSKLKAAAYQKGGVNVKKMFKHYAKKFNSDGPGNADAALDPEEFRLAVRKDLKQPKELVTDQEIRKVFRIIDSDGSGAIKCSELEEFLALGPDDFQKKNRRRPGGKQGGPGKSHGAAAPAEVGPIAMGAGVPHPGLEPTSARARTPGAQAQADVAMQAMSSMVQNESYDEAIAMIAKLKRADEEKALASQESEKAAMTQHIAKFVEGGLYDEAMELLSALSKSSAGPGMRANMNAAMGAATRGANTDSAAAGRKPAERDASLPSIATPSALKPQTPSAACELHVEVTSCSGLLPAVAGAGLQVTFACAGQVRKTSTLAPGETAWHERVVFERVPEEAELVVHVAASNGTSAGRIDIPVELIADGHPMKGAYRLKHPDSGEPDGDRGKVELHVQYTVENGPKLHGFSADPRKMPVML